MVNTLVLYDVPRRASRQRLEALLRAHGFTWLFPYARWSSARLSQHDGLIQGVRSRLKGEAYTLVFIEMTANSRRRARWLTATRPR
jgi:CRISPR/Cas system-associated endoribonuclease Cas2